jgi:hypothetical protein
MKARREEAVKQIVLAIDLEAKRTPLAIEPGHRRRLVELMAEAILAVQHAGERDNSEEEADDDAREQ